MCFPNTLVDGKWEWECPEGYHSTQDDETGQCYPDTEPCYPGHLSDPDTTNCSDEDWVCEKFNLTGCIVDGRLIGTFPDQDCLRYPDNENANALKNLLLVIAVIGQFHDVCHYHMKMQTKPRGKDRY